MNRQYFQIVVIGLGLMAGLLVAGGAKDPLTPLETSGLSNPGQGNVAIKGFHLEEYKGSFKTHTLQARNLFLKNNENTVELEGMNLVQSSPDRGIEYISSEKALFNMKTRIISLTGKVFYRSGMNQLSCQKLSWDINNKKINVPGAFSFQRGNTQFLSGSNLTASDNLEQGSMENIEASGK
jgi:lipopolysaccharide assembly outer membrane protein LptD (OstA)